MKTFLINLDKNAERMASATKRLAEVGVEFERVPAVYGKALSAAERRECFDAFRWWCAMGRPATPGEIGCAMSHLNVYRRMTEENIPFACVMEDDVVPGDKIKSQLQFVEEWYRAGNEGVVLVSNHSRKDLASDGQVIFEQGERKIVGGVMDYFTECYTLTLNDARKILKANCPVCAPADAWGRWGKYYGLKLLHVIPSAAAQDGQVSDVREGWFTIKYMIPHKMMRVVGLAIDRFLLMLGKLA